MEPTSTVRTYRMHERASHLDFDIRFQGARDELAMPHRHGYFQIQVCLEGDSEQMIGGVRRPFQKGHLSFVLPHRVHVIAHPPGSRYCIVNFDQRFLWPDLPVDALEIDELPASEHPELAPFLLQEYVDIRFVDASFDRVVGWLDELQDCNTRREFGSLTMARGLLHQLIGFCSFHHAQVLLELSERKGMKASRNDALRRVKAYIRDHLDRDMSLTQAAAAAFLSPSYLAHLLKKETGRTFVELVTERRLMKAKKQLLSSGLQVQEIAAICGFQDQAYFTRRFRQYVGCTPHQYRESNGSLSVGG